MITYFFFALSQLTYRQESCSSPIPNLGQSMQSGPSSSKLTMSLVNVLLELWSLNMAYTLIFLLKKMWVALCKSYSHFFSKNTCELDIVLTKTVNSLNTKKLVKLTMLQTTGPRSSSLQIMHKWSLDSSISLSGHIHFQFQEILVKFIFIICTLYFLCSAQMM